MHIDYPEYYEEIRSLMDDLGEQIPETMQGFQGLHKGSMPAGALSGKVKELLALAIAITVRCDGCISYHVHDALQAGASRAEIGEAIGVAILMGGGPSVVYGAQALQAVDQFETKQA